MKNKSTRHKEDNVFKFQPFSERISNLNINVFHHVAHEYEAQLTDDTKCFFYQAIEKWNVLNLTESYEKFKKDVKPRENITLAQLIYNKEHVVKTSLQHIKDGNILCLQPLLEILVALVEDLQTDFYEYYPDCLTVLIKLLNTKDTDQLEWTLTCLAYIFKLLWRVLIKDIDNVFKTLLPLLSDNKPEYINNFASESFAFVARKVKNRKAFLLLILKTVKETKDGITGTGRLLFEVIKGVNGQFHSCAESWLSLYFEQGRDHKSLFSILEEVVKHIVNNIHPQNSEVFSVTVLKCLDETLQTWKEEKKEIYLNQILKCIGQVVEYRKGSFVLHPISIISVLIKLFTISDLSDEIILSATKIIVLLLLSKNIKLQQEQASLLTRTALSIQSTDAFLFFIENTFHYSSFEPLILPTFLKQCVKIQLERRFLKILAKLILAKSPLFESGMNIENWKKYPLDFNTTINNNMMEDILLKHVKIENKNLDFSEECYIYSLICIPHVKRSARINQILFENINKLCEIIGSQENLKRTLFLLLTTFECAVHILERTELICCEPLFFKYILPLCSDIRHISALKILDMFLTVTREETVNMEKIQLINASLEKNLNSPYHEVRLYTSHIYSLFDSVLQQQFKDPLEEWNLFAICHKIQCITPHVHTYREQLIHLDKLNFERPQISLCKNTEFKVTPLRFLCGTLYMNFKLLWDPLIKLIASHAVGLDINSFWNVYVEELKTVVVNMMNEKNGDDDLDTFDCDLLNSLYTNVYSISVKPDFRNYRLNLWKAMCLFPEIAEAKTRDVSVLLLDFIEKEYQKLNAENALTWNIKQNDPIETILDSEDPVNDDVKPNVDVSHSKPKGKYDIRALIQHLEVFAKVRSAKSMYKEAELYQLYFDLLSHKNVNVQKVALDCIMTYKFKYLMPYKDHLYNLIDDKNFKNELVAFKVDEESAMIQEEHRNGLIPVIMKLVFSRMMSKIGLRTGGKSSGQFRRNIIFRFLAGCRENEMMDFVRMAFRYYNGYLNDDAICMINTISSSINLETFIPPKRLQSSLNMINVVLEQFGALMGNELLSYLLKIIIIIGVFVRTGFEQQNNLHDGYISIFRNLRAASLKIIDRIFTLFENYRWASHEINAIYDVFIWPYLRKLPIEGIHSPTAILKLLITWGTYPRYFNLLVKHYDDDTSYYPLASIITLLLNEKSHPSVCKSILEMIERLLTLEHDEQDIEMKINLTNELPICQIIKQKLKSKEAFNFGSCILLPHANSIVQKIERTLGTKSKNVSRRELFILSRISELVWEPAISDNLLNVILPIAIKKCAQNCDEETVLQMMATINNLLLNVQHPEKHLKQISPLFAQVAYPSSRKLLCQALNTIARNEMREFILIEEVMKNINAWDSKWVDQPDFQIRGDTFRKIQTLIIEDNISLELGILLIYNSYYLLKNEKDLALKENASHCLKSVSPYLVKKYYKTGKHSYILDETLFSIIRNGFRSQNLDVRNECILLLGRLSRECHESHVVLRDLHKLTNDQDLEVDFFENIIHLQVHRHGRALLRFASIYKEEVTLPNIRSLTQFILPLITHYLCNEKFANKNSIIDAANEAVGIVCRLLPWHQYEGLLKFYLLKLRQKGAYQRQLVKLIVTILDSFHFDLSKGHKIEQFKETVGNTFTNNQLANNVDSETTTKSNDEEVNAEENESKLNDDNEDEMEEFLHQSQDLDDTDDTAEEPEVKHSQNGLKVYQKTTVLCKSTATRVIQTIQVVLLPQLHKSLAEMTHYDTSHKLNRKKTGIEREEEDLLRVPISLALVKLLQKLPKEILDNNLPGIFMKLCTFLKSQLESVRRMARETLQKIMLTLGPSYLRILIDEMVPLLSRGFQVHVLVYTMHAVLVSLKEMFQAKDIDVVLNTIIKLCNADLFGILAEEKEIEKIITKVSEAKSTKSLDTYQILGQYITEKCMMDLILPIKNILSSSHSFKTVNKAQECLRHIAQGLIENVFIPVESLLKFSFGVASESVPELFATNLTVLTEKERERLEREKPDCFIIPKEPKYRSGYKSSTVKSSNNTNAHILVEFGLRLCHLLLKRDKIRDVEFRPFLDPFVPIFKNCLTSKNIKLSTMTLQCFSWIFKYDLPLLKDNITEIAKLMFEILHKYGSAGLSKGDNFDLVVSAFKAMAVLIRDVKYFNVEEEQLKVLLLYVEQDLYDHDRQATAFGLLKAILSRKLVVPELFDVMTKIAELSITSELPHIRLQSRLASHQFLMDYPLGRKLDKHITFYLAQLKYEAISGRESALEMIQTLVNSFPMKVLKDYSKTFLITLGARLINDSEPGCRKLAADCVNSMISRLSKSDRDPLFNIFKIWLKEDNIMHKRLAAQLCGILVTVEKTSFETRISSLLPLIKQQFGIYNNSNDQPGKFVKLNKEDDTDSEELEKAKDHHLFQVLQLLLKIAAQCPTFLKNTKDIEEISKFVQTLLAHPHDWVRLAAAQFLGFVLSSLDIKNLQELLSGNKSASGYLHSNPVSDIKSLSLDLCDQLHPQCVRSDLAEQVIKNLVFVARVLEIVPLDNSHAINLLWLAKRMRKVVNSEIVDAPTSSILRTEVFKWIAGVVTVLDLKNLEKILHHLLAPLVREMVSTEETDSAIRQLSKDVSLLIKKKIGIEKYTEILSKLQQQLSIKRAERKRSRNQLAVTDPEIFAKKKIKHHEKKKEAKKRKISERKGSIKKFKRKKVELDTSEIM